MQQQRNQITVIPVPSQSPVVGTRLSGTIYVMTPLFCGKPVTVRMFCVTKRRCASGVTCSYRRDGTFASQEIFRENCQSLSVFAGCSRAFAVFSFAFLVRLFAA